MSTPRAEPGLRDTARQFAAAVLVVLHSRVSLAGLELGEARDRLLLSLLQAIGAALLAGAAVLAFSAWVVITLWERFGPGVVLGVAVAYALAAVLLWWRMRAGLRDAPPLLADTLAELQRDAQALAARRGAGTELP